MAFIDRVLQPPAYGWKDDKGELIIPTRRQLFAEILSRMNVFATRKNWSAVIGWFWVACLIPFMVIFFAKYFSWPLLGLMLLYGAVGMSTHGTIWYHRYCTHRSYKFTNRFWRFITHNLVIKVIPDEIYVVSHHVHHSKSDQPGDPYNATAGFLYCFLADINHQPIAKDLDENDYNRVVKFLNHTGTKTNSYQQYQKWGAATHLPYLLLRWILNWGFWFGAFYLLGGPGLAFAMFGGALLWALAVRTFNYNGHGGGKDMRKDGIDFNRKDMSINQSRPGLLGGEWHNNHHLYPSSARAGFLPYQLDSAFIYIYLLHKLGGVSSYHDSKEQFYKDYYKPEPQGKSKPAKD